MVLSILYLYRNNRISISIFNNSHNHSHGHFPRNFLLDHLPFKHSVLGVAHLFILLTILILTILPITYLNCNVIIAEYIKGLYFFYFFTLYC